MFFERRESVVSINAPTALLTVDGLAPRSIAEPASLDELAAALREANERGHAVVPWGAGRHMSLGNIPARYDLALRMTKLDRVIEYEPADLTITVEAGLTMSQLQSVLAEHGQFLPIDAPAEATAGGVLSAGLSGPSAHAYGLPRDGLIGCKIALADGTVVKAGGRVVKNVAGYDMQKLVVGSIGTLGVMAEATFKVAPLPPAQQTLVATFSTVDEAAAAVRAADQRSLALRAVALRLARAHVTAAFWLSGPQSAVERTRRELGEVCGAALTERLEGEAPTRWWPDHGQFADAADAVTLRVSLLPSDVGGFCGRMRDHAGEIVAYPTTGLLLARLAPGGVDDIVGFVEDARREAIERGGSLVMTAAPVEVKTRIDVWGPAGSAQSLMRRLKEQFDPRDTLNPGRYVRVM
jgi:glycolate oxidase FAD binding subunit